MIAAMLLAASAPAPMTAVDAERAFAADAQTLGQWTAFRKWSTADAIMFDPKPVRTHDLLKDAKDPPRAIRWWPTASYISCDGRMAVNTGGWERPDGSVGYFTTVWRKGDEGWRWTVDGGDALTTPRPRLAAPLVRKATCAGASPQVLMVPDGGKAAAGQAADGSLIWQWTVAPDGARSFSARIWNGRGYDAAIDDRIAAPPPKAP